MDEKETRQHHDREEGRRRFLRDTLSAAAGAFVLVIGLGAAYLIIRWTGFFKIED